MMFQLQMFLLGILITGGRNESSSLSSAEVFIPALNQSCSLSNMIQSRFRHTQNNFLSCGGDENGNGKKCEVYSPHTGNWSVESYDLREMRYGHTSWSLGNGNVVLLGGWSSNSTTEIVIQGNGTSRGFDLEHPRM